jgi:methyltransferase (TIGR00027 family)
MPSPNSPSVTMQAVCAARVDNDIADPIASSLLQALPEARSFRDELDKLSRGMFTRTIMMRSHFFSKALADHENKFEQLVVLCSGLDFRYINYPGWAATPTFLIDHPDSLALTNELTMNHSSMLVNTKMVAVDLVLMTPTTIQQNLLNNGFDPKKPTLFLWEGATYYFQPAVVYQTIASISALCSKSSLVIDFANEGSFMQKRQPVRQEGEEQDGVTKTMDLLSKKREPWFGFFKPSIISEQLQQAGFTSVHTVWDSILEKDLFGDIKMVPESMFYVQATK